MVYIYIEPTEGNWYILVIEATEVNWYVLVFENISIPWTKLSWTYWRILVYICVMNLLKETGIVLNSVSAVLLCVTEIMHPIPEYFSRFKIQKSRKFWPIPGYFSSTKYFAGFMNFKGLVPLHISIDVYLDLNSSHYN